MTDILITHFIIFLFVFVRIISVFTAAPLFSNENFPVLAKIALSLITAYVIFSFMDKGNVQLEISLWFIATNVLKEVVTGLVIGFSVNIIFYAVSFAGSIMGFDIGLAMANVFNPSEGTQNNVIGEYIYILAIFIFILINGHHYIIRGLTYSFSIIPLGHYSIDGEVYNHLVKLSAAVFVLAVKIASPIMVTFFLVHIGAGILARIIPQMQVFFVLYPLKIGLGIFLLILTTPLYLYIIKNLLSSYEEKLYQLIQMMS